jgi:hypothetical protein
LTNKEKYDIIQPSGKQYKMNVLDVAEKGDMLCNECGQRQNMATMH